MARRRGAEPRFTLRGPSQHHIGEIKHAKWTLKRRTNAELEEVIAHYTSERTLTGDRMVRLARAELALRARPRLIG